MITTIITTAWDQTEPRRVASRRVVCVVRLRVLCTCVLGIRQTPRPTVIAVIGPRPLPCYMIQHNIVYHLLVYRY